MTGMTASLLCGCPGGDVWYVFTVLFLTSADCSQPFYRAWTRARLAPLSHNVYSLAGVYLRVYILIVCWLPKYVATYGWYALWNRFWVVLLLSLMIPEQLGAWLGGSWLTWWATPVCFVFFFSSDSSMGSCLSCLTVSPAKWASPQLNGHG